PRPEAGRGAGGQARSERVSPRSRSGSSRVPRRPFMALPPLGVGHARRWGYPAGRSGETMATATYRVFDPLLPRVQAEGMLRLCERFGPYGTYAEEASEAEIGQGLFQRHDAVMNFLKTGGRFGRHDSVESLGARTNYFRASYAYGDEVCIEGIEPFLRFEGFVEAARAIH